MIRIDARDVHLTFRPGHRAARSWKDFLLARWLGRAAAPPAAIPALQGVTFQVAEGGRLGVIGHNGAGKSTLLRVLAGVYRPGAGTCSVHGRVSSLFELALGFEPEATGWENVRYRGYLMRESPRSIAAKLPAIADFSELGDAMDRPVRTYSRGMLVRLAFAIATACDPEVLLIDEVLAAGDLAFLAKARRRMRELIHQARALVLVSHDLGSVRELCDRVLWLEHGQVRALGPSGDVVPEYKRFMKHQGKARARAA